MKEQTEANKEQRPTDVASSAVLGRMSEREKTLLNECCKYAIGTTGNKYYRLGGHGYVPLRWNYATLRNLEKAGLVEYIGYWKATQKGQDLMRPNDQALLRADAAGHQDYENTK
jgi:hypothetical protein